MKEVLKQIKLLELSTKNLVDGLITGNYHSVFKGSGMEFSEIREYRPGDDIRPIDWNVTARYNKPYVKEFIEERDLRVYFLIDMSGSFNFGNTVSKNRKALELVASLMFSATKNNDSIGLFISTDNIEKFVRDRKGRRHVLMLLKNILSFSPESKLTNLNNSLKSVSNILKKRSLLFIVSDFVSDDFSKSISILRKHHDVVAIKLSDKNEKEMLDIGLIELEDEETGDQILVDTSDENFRKKYEKIVKEYEANILKVFRKNKIDVIEFFTDEDYKNQLKKFFKIRRFRIAR